MTYQQPAEAPLQNALQAAARGSTKAIPNREVDEHTRTLALKIGQMMAALPPAVREDFLSWANAFTGK